MAKKTIKFIQINLHHAKASSSILSKTFIKSKLDIALLQEPWAYNNKVLGMPTQKCKLVYDSSQLSPRTAILVNTNMRFVPITEFIDNDIVAIMLEVPTTKGKTILYAASAYFPGDVDDIPPPKVAAFISYCRRQNKAFIIGCDANAHHTIWNSTDTNKKGESLLEFISQHDIDICNRGSSPTFTNSIREEVLDLTLCNSALSERMQNWHVSDEISMSDHNHILFDYIANDLLDETYRDPRKTNWEIYSSTIESEGDFVPNAISSHRDLEKASENIINKIKEAYYSNCPERKRSTNRNVSWWNKRLEKLRSKARKLFNKAKQTSDWVKYREALTEYNKEIRRSKRRDWRFNCENIESIPVVSRLQKVLSKNHSNGLGVLKNKDGSFTANTKETLDVMMQVHFPGSLPISNSPDTNSPNSTSNEWCSRPAELENRAEDLANEIFTIPRVEWAIESFAPFKSPGVDEIYPIFLQKCKRKLVPALTKLYRASLLLRYIPTAWRQSRVVFIPKANKKDETSAKSFRPISLASIFLKVMEKLVDEYIKDVILSKNPLSKLQFAYQSNKSTVTALHTIVTKVEKAFEAKEVLLAAFLDIEGAFDNATYASMENAMKRHGFENCLVEWIGEMLSKREIQAKLCDSTVKVTAVKGCPQGGVLSPLLWSLVVDDLLVSLELLGFEVIGFADDIVIVVRGKFDSIISERMQTALNFTLQWCRKEGLNVNPTKTTLVPFTKRRKMNLNTLQLDRASLKYSTETKYLGVILDSKLNWNAHTEQVLKKATCAFWICKRTFGKKWGLKPNMICWIYSAIIKPRITYASLIWWPKTKQKTAQIRFGKLQRLVTTSITGAMGSTPSKALDAILNFLPLSQIIQLEAGKNAIRLRRTKELFEGDLTGHLSILKQFQLNSLLLKNEDLMSKKHTFNQLFKVFESNRSEWEHGGPCTREGSIIFYTDGSKMGNKVGAGITGPGVKLSVAMGKWPTVFQAEIYAILECTAICLKRKYRNANICIFSDSQAALNALKSVACTSKLVSDCVVMLQQLATHNKVNLYWVPGHCGVEGNEKADELARHGSEMEFVGPEPFCGVSSCILKMEFKEWEKSQVLLNWSSTTIARHAKQFIQPNALITQKLLGFSKKDLSTYIGLITGHCPSKYHLKIIGKTDDDVCRFCYNEVENAQHLLCECTAIFNQRRKFLDKGLLEPREIWAISPYKVLRFIRNIIPCWENAFHQDDSYSNT